MLVHKINFKVKGVTFKNEDGKDIQKEIIKILKEYKKNEYFDSLYGGYTNKEIKEMDLNVSEYEGYQFPAKLVGDEYDGEECLKIYFKTYEDEYIHVGYAPKETLKEIGEWINKTGLKVDGKLEVTGGKYKHVELYEEDYEEKEQIVTEELTYGLELTLMFYDENISQNENKQVKKDNNLNENKYFYLKLLFSFGCIGFIIYSIIKIILYLFDLILS